MGSEPMCNTMNVIAVVALLAICLMIAAAYRMIRAKAFIWLGLGWAYALGVRFYAMLCGFGVYEPPAYTTLNALMALVYVFLGIGIWAIVRDLRRIWSRIRK